MVDPIRPAKLADAIAVRLERMILEGSLRPNERLLGERELAQKFDVSRPSVREALEKLEQKGLLRGGKRGETFVVPLLDQDFVDPLWKLLKERPDTEFECLEFRIVVDRASAYMASVRATEVDRQTLGERFEDLVAAHNKQDPSEEAEADTNFHIAIYEASHNMLVLHIMRSLADILFRRMFDNRSKLYLRQGVRDLLLEQHREIYQAVISGDATAARQAAETHVIFTRDALKKIAVADARLERSLRRIARHDPSDADETAEG